MLGEKSDVYANKYETEVYFSSAAVEGDSSYKGESVSKCCKKGEYGAHRKNIVKVGYDIVSVMKNNIERGVS